MAKWRRAAPARAAALAVALLTAAAACREPATPQQPWRVVVAYPSTLSSLHPALSSDEFSYSIVSNVYEPLVDMDPHQALRPSLAVAWHSVDELTWQFELRPGATFHDGRAVDAPAVAASLERVRLDPELRFTATLQPVESFRAAADGTLEVRTRFPVPDLAARLTELGIWAEPAAAGGTLVGSGPYRVASWTPLGEVTLERVRGAGPEQMVFRAVADAAERVAALRRGEVDLVAEVPAGDLAGLRKETALRVLESRGLRVLFLGMNCEAAERADIAPPRNPFRDLRVRRAVGMAIDRAGLVRGPLGGLAEVLDQPLAPEVFGFAAGLPPLDFDPDAARRLLAEAGWANGFTTALDFVPGKYRDVDRAIEAIVADLGRVGVRVNPRPSAYPAFLELLVRRDTPFYLRGWSTSVSAGQTYEYLLRTANGSYGGANAGGYSNPALDALLDAASREGDDAKRLLQLQRAGEMIRQDLPLVPLYRQFNLYAARAALGFEPRLDRTVRGAELSRRPS
jgi:peptide/nickel transport system substrate-binding protein